jgi:hypothetical protein
MGARGRVKLYGNQIPIRFRRDAETEIRILAAMWSVTIPEVVRILTSEALASREASIPNGRISDAS